MKHRNWPSIGDLIALIMLKILLKTMKKGQGVATKIPPPAFLMFPKAALPKSDLVLENKRIIYRCGQCNQKFILRSDIKLNQKTVMMWMGEVKGHKCHVG